MMLSVESQQVMLLRTLKIAGGGSAAEKEAMKMVSEKIHMATLQTGRMMLGASSGNVIRQYRAKVRNNVKRLTK